MTEVRAVDGAVHIDGAIGEGGGQILRTSLSLSMVTGRPVRVDGIRAGRARPGLLRQHLTAVRAAQGVCGAAVEGAAIGSTALTFAPGAVRAGEYEFSIGTAGSTTLVLQTVLPALLAAGGPSTVTLEGGTHNTHAPSVRFLERAFLPVLARMGARVELRLERHGFYPAGGGRVVVSVEPAARLLPVELVGGGEPTHRLATATVAALSPEIAKRELAVVERLLGWPREALRVEQLADGVGPGNVLSLEVGRGGVTEVFTGFGERGRSAESVARGAAEEVRAYLAGGWPVGPHLADQLMLPLALAGAGRFRTGPLSRHAETNARVIGALMPGRLEVEADPGGSVEVRGVGVS